MKHKHAEVIKAWADGETIQVATIGKEDWVDIGCPTWALNVEYRIKPDAPKWPETTMTDKEINQSIVTEDFQLVSRYATETGRRIANAAIAHACETGQLVTKDAYDHVVHARDKAQCSLVRAGFVDNGAEEWKPPVNPKAAELIAAIAGIESRDEQISILRDTTTRQDSMIQELRADRNEQDMKIAQAVKDAAINAFCKATPHMEIETMYRIDLESIIKEATK